MSLSDSVEWLQALLQEVPELPRTQRPRPYFSQRVLDAPISAEPEPLPKIARRVYQLVRKFEEQHYFSETLGYECVDGNGQADSSPTNELDIRVGKAELWDGRFDEWTESDLCDFIEIFHDLAARPTKEYFHSYGGCGYHPEAFSRRSGQAIYTWRMNELLDMTPLGLRLATEGLDAGRMVRAPSGELASLTAEALAGETEVKDDLAHAIALFRSRDGTRQDRRSAIVALALILEGRRSLLKAELVTKDEGALFHIANSFDVRHRNPKQLADYDDVFLEWIFYWYLATVRLTDQILAAQALATGPLFP